MGLGLDFTAPDGTYWDLRRGVGPNASGGPKITDDGIQGLSMPDVDFQLSQTPALDGQRLDGWSLKDRTVFFPFKWSTAALGDVEGSQRAWWRSHLIGLYGQFRATDQSGKHRTLTCRFQDDAARATALDPYVPAVQKWGENWIADDPWWYGDLATFRYQLNGAGNPLLFGPNNYGPPFYINPGYSTGPVVISNEGDVDTWPDWVIDGPTTAVQVTINGQTIAYNVNLPAGRRVLLQSDPARQVAYLGTPGATANTLAEDLSTLAPVTRTWAALDFPKIPRSSKVTAQFVVTGQGAVTAAFRPKFLMGF